MRTVLILLFLIFSINLKAQTFVKEYGQLNADPSSGKLIETVDTGYVFCYNIKNSPDPKSQIFIFKINALGDTIWTSVIDGGDSSVCEIWDVTSIGDSSYLLSGHWESNSATDSISGISIIKIDLNGNIIWNKILTDSSYHSGLQGMQVIGTFDNGILITSWSNIIKFDSVGNLQWSFHFPSVNQCNYFTPKETNDKGVVLLGTTINGSNTILYKIDSVGNLMWRKVFTQTGGGNHLLVDNSNNITMTTEEGVFYLDSAANLIWNIWMDINPISLYSITKAVDGSYYAAGNRYHTGGNAIIRIDTSGNIIWGKQLLHTGSNYPFSLHQTFDGGFIMESGMSLIKTDSSFSVYCDTSISIPLNTLFPYPGLILNDTLLIQTPLYFISASPQFWTIKHGCQIIDLCSTTNIKVSEVENDIKIYPNPSTGKIYFTNEINKLEVYSLIGEKVAEFSNIKSYGSIDLSNQQPGIYFLRGLSEENYTFTSKIVLQ